MAVSDLSPLVLIGWMGPLIQCWKNNTPAIETEMKWKLDCFVLQLLVENIIYVQNFQSF